MMLLLDDLGMFNVRCFREIYELSETWMKPGHCQGKYG